MDQAKRVRVCSWKFVIGSGEKGGGRSGGKRHPRRVVRVHPDQACIRVAGFLMWERSRKLNVDLFELGGGPLGRPLATQIPSDPSAQKNGG
jgi:hypothetical protein